MASNKFELLCYGSTAGLSNNLEYCLEFQRTLYSSKLEAFINQVFLENFSDFSKCLEITMKEEIYDNFKNIEDFTIVQR